jgi:hypothetical protein
LRLTTSAAQAVSARTLSAITFSASPTGQSVTMAVFFTGQWKFNRNRPAKDGDKESTCDQTTETQFT